MDLPEHPLRTSAAIEELGTPGAEGRWQPTRAGAVNSWAWADEQFLFADGWLALAGPNGSGKSLTASMLITVLLDADTSQTALSTDEKAAGTLTSRHTDRSANEDRTGTWWLEYGCRDAETGQVRYLTTGLWLRSTSSGLQRAYFIASGRVGTDLHLQRDREPVRLEDLAEQLATTDGDLYTNADKLKQKANKFLPAIGEETDYRAAVRTRLFAGLDEVQFAALMSVLRSLRSLRTGERISPDKMRNVLTDALPALDEDGLTMIAESMERIAKNEADLERIHQEAKALSGVENRYTRYVRLLAQVEAAGLQSANHEVEQLTRRTRSFTDKLKAAQKSQERIREDQAANNETLAELDGRLGGIDVELQGHAGATLPEKELLAASLAEQAAAAAERSEQAQTTAHTSGDRAAISDAAAADSRNHLAELGSELRRGGGALGADSALDQLLAASTQLVDHTGSQLKHPSEQGVDLAGSPLADVSAPRLDAATAHRLTQTPHAWVDDRQQQIARVRDALGSHGAAQSALHETSEVLNEAEDNVELALQETETAQQCRSEAEATLVHRIDQWQSGLRQLAPGTGPLPTSAVGGDDGGERLNLDAVARQADTALSTTLREIDEPGHQLAAIAAAGEAQHAAATASAAAQRHQRAQTAHQLAIGERTELAATHAQEAGIDEQAGRAADETHFAAVTQAQDEAGAAARTFADSVEIADREARTWTSEVGAWLAGLSQMQLSPADLNLYTAGPDDAAPDTVLLELERLDPSDVVQSVDSAQRAVADPLRIRIVEAEPRLEQAKNAVRDLEDRLAQALAEDHAPAAPAWRDRDHTQGTPLWKAVDYAADVTEETADRVEGALLVSGLLDALITADGHLVAGDLTITGTEPCVSPSLADVLCVAADYRDHNSADATRVGQILAAIPITAPGGDLRTGVLAVGPVTAIAPDSYRAAFIGPAARRRAQEARVAQLRAEIGAAQVHLAGLGQTLAELRDAEQTANREHGTFPSPLRLVETRREAGVQRTTLQRVRADTAAQIARADQTHRQVHQDLSERASERRTQMLLLDQLVNQTEAAQAETAAAWADADATAQTAATAEQETRERLATAQADAAVANTERREFPSLDEAATAQADEDQTLDALARARAAAGIAADRHHKASREVTEQLHNLHRAATLPHGAILPTTDRELNAHAKAVETFVRQIDAWERAATRASELLDRAGQDGTTATAAAALAQQEATKAEVARNNALRVANEVAEIRALHGAEYEQLHARRTQLDQDRRAARQRTRDLDTENLKVHEAAAEARTELANIEPRQKLASDRRGKFIDRLCRLIDERLASIATDTAPQDLPARDRAPIATDALGHPADLSAALAWAKDLLGDRPGPSELDNLEAQRDKAEQSLEREARNASSSLVRYDSQVTLHTIEGTSWRRAVVADPESTQGQDLHQAVQSLRVQADQLEDDLRDDMKQAMRAGLFTRLYRDINLRRQTARQLVGRIQDTLKDVRTGIAQVGVQVAWQVRDDDDAKRMVDLISQPPSDEVFDQMYTVLRQRMNEMPGERFEKRVAHAFDYRAWHQWDIEITHSSFGQAAGKPVFQKVEARANPLASLSTGERRLATMLPLLAAAWSMYGGDSGEYTGPRLLMIDEIDAAFDDANLRQVLKLLRSWDFDVVATTPSIAPILKRETQRSVIHELVKSGQHRITIPWLWEGYGEPQLLELQPTLDEAD